MTELLDYANKKAENLGSLLFTSEIALQPIGQPVGYRLTAISLGQFLKRNTLE